MKIDQRSLTDCQDVKSFGMIDVLKLLCALLVIVVHVPPFGNTASPALQGFNYIAQQGVGRMAVPFFFVCTGFLHFRRAGEGKTILASSWGYAKKILRLYLLWTAIYLPFILRDVLMNPQGIMMGLARAVQDFLVTGSYVHLWYLHASMVAVLLVGVLLSRKVPLRRVMCLAGVCYALGLLAQTYFGAIRPLEAYPAVWGVLKTVQRVIVTHRNGVMIGFVFVAVGAVLARQPIRLSMKKAALSLAASLVLLAAEMTVLTRIGWIRENDSYLALVPIAFFTVYLAAHVHLDNAALCKRLRSISTWIYFIHIWVRGALILFSGALGLGWTDNAMLFVLTTVISVGLSILLERLAAGKRFAWLRKLV